MIELYSGEQIDRLGYQGLKIIQNPAKFKFTIDAFLLTAFINPEAAATVIDLGTGGGVIALLIAGEKEVGCVYGLEIQPDLVSMAQRSACLNNLEGKVIILEGDIKNPPGSLTLNSFDYVVSNPPFFSPVRGVISDNSALAMAKFEIACDLTDVVKAATKLVKPNGKVALIYPSERLDDLLQVLAHFKLTPKKLRLIYPRPETKSNLFLLEARPHAKSGLEVLPPLFVYDRQNQYTDEMNRIFGK